MPPGSREWIMLPRYSKVEEGLVGLGVWMKKKILIVAFVLSIMALPALGDLTEYQMGFSKGMEVGFLMGDLKGRALYSSDGVKEYNSYLDQYNNLISYVFWDNTTILRKYFLGPMYYMNPATQYGPMPDAHGRIGEYPADAFYTATGSGPRANANNPGANAMPWV